MPIKVVEKLWGREEWLVNEPEYCAKRLYIEPGFASSLHFHVMKKETFIVEKGRILLLLAHDPTLELGPGDSRTISPGTRHCFMSLDGESIVLEVSTYHDDEDVVRIEPSRSLKA